ncbi:MAG: class IV adenylate cyclase, partial [Sciscionella sp.]
MIEAELKADVRQPEQVAAQLRRWADEDTSIYRDTYYESADHALGSDGRQLRVRTISGATTKHLLTYKEPSVDIESQSKPEYETQIIDRDVIDYTLLGIGMVVDISFEKHCRNYQLNRDGRRFLASLVQVPEIDQSVFIEIETMVPNVNGPAAALESIRKLLTELGIDPATDVNSRTYQD